MKKNLLVITLLASITGCTSLTPQNNYMEISRETPPAIYIGTWTGTIGHYLSTFKINSDGSGIMCNSWHKHNSVERIKFNAGSIYPQSGSSINLSPQDNTLIGKIDSFGSGTYIFVRDDKLDEAAPYCLDKI